MKLEENFPIDPELEARVVAWVLREASPFEVAELERQVAANPALAAFKRRIEAVHGLLGDAARPATATLKLAPERRAKLLGLIGAPPKKSEAGSVMALRPLGSRMRSRIPLWAPALAACLVVGFVIFRTFNATGSKFGPGGFKLGVARSSAPAQLPAIQLKQELAIEEAEKRESERKTEDIAKRREREPISDSAVIGGVPRGPSFGATSTVPVPRKMDIPQFTSDAGTLNSVSVGGNLDARQLVSTSPSSIAGRYNVASSGGTTFNYNARAKSASYGAAYVDGSAGGILSSGSGSLSGDSGQNLSVNGSLSLSSEAKEPVTFAATSRTAPASSDEVASTTGAPVTLSPFQVITPADRGYNGTSTLAGTRINTNLRDAGSAISVVTKRFLADAGAVSKDSTLAYEAQPADDKLAFLAPRSAATESAAIDGDKPVAHRPTPVENASAVEISDVQAQPLSTFSLHVSDVSFRLAQEALARGEMPDPTSIRPEEFYNAFDYGDPAPVTGEPVACHIEQAAHPFAQQRDLVRIAMRVPAAGRSASQPLRLTILVDTSGSMEREDRVASVRRAMQVLASLLGANDQITLIGFARQPRLLAERVPGTDAAKLADIIARTPAEGGTNFEEALKLAGEKARSQLESSAQNRIVALTDGAANLGNDDPTALANQVAALRQEGISFDACGIGVEGLDDSVLEALTRKGDGRYYVINSPDQADAAFARKLAGALHPAAQNVKVQVRFNPARVQSYRLIGFEQHRLKAEDFRNDKVTAAELAGNEEGVAVYEVQPKPDGEGELGDVFVRFRDTVTGNMVERSWTMFYEPQAPSFARAPASIQLAGTAALLAEKLQGGDAAKQIRLSELEPEINQLRGHYAHDRRVQEFITMFGEARWITGD